MFVPRAKRELWERACELRRAGWSLREIARQLDVALSSVSVWTRGVIEQEPVAPAGVGQPAASSDDPPRWCSRCASFRPTSSFNRLATGFQWWCRECFKRYYAEGRAHHRQRTNTLKRQRVAEAQQLVLEYLGTRPCADCGERDPVVLEFDHVGAKRAEVSMLVRRGVLPAVLMQEIARCEVVCANCHRRRTAGREGWRRLAPDLAAGRWRSVRHERNVRFVVAALIASGCVDCGERDACVLEFDHLGEKTGGVMRLARNEVGLTRLQAEIERCEARCVNCHRHRTSAAGGHFRARSEIPPARVELALRD